MMKRGTNGSRQADHHGGCGRGTSAMRLQRIVAPTVSALAVMVLRDQDGPIVPTAQTMAAVCARPSRLMWLAPPYSAAHALAGLKSP
jgi:hypothetical protein